MKNILITGSGRGIGAAIARRLSREDNVRIFINYRKSKDSAIKLQNEIRQKGIDCIAYKCDISNPYDVKNMFEDIQKNFKGIDVLINNAGISKTGLFQDMNFEEWNELFSVNVNGVFNTVKAALPYMLANNYGRILNFSSIWGHNAASCEVGYSATKGAIEAFTRSLAAELAPSNIYINAIAPGSVKTSMMNDFSDDDIKSIENNIPMMRMASPEEIAEIAAFLISDNNSYMTGQIITVDGGFCL